jgi:hypothetical protein
MSKIAQRSVVYKPLVFDGPRGVAGRIGATLKHLKGLGDNGRNGHDQGVQTSGNFSGVGVPARQNLSEIQQVATRETSATRLPELPGQLETHEENGLYGYFNRLFSGGDNTRRTGTVGSAVGMTPHPGTEVVDEGQTVGQILGVAAGEASRFAALTAPIPVVNGVTAAAAAGLGGAAAGVAAGEALGEGDVLGAISNGREAYRQGQQLQAIGNGLSIAHGQTVTIEPANANTQETQTQTRQLQSGSSSTQTDHNNAVQLTETRGVGTETDITGADMQNANNIVQELLGLRADQEREINAVRQRVQLREAQLNDSENNVLQLREQFDHAQNEIQRLRRDGVGNDDERFRRALEDRARLEEGLLHAQREENEMRRNLEALHQASRGEIDRGRREIARLQAYIENQDLPRYGAVQQVDFGVQAEMAQPPAYAPPRPNLVDQAIQAARETRPREEGGIQPGPVRARARPNPTANAGTQFGDNFAGAEGHLPNRMHPIENRHAFRRRGNTISTQTPHFEPPAPPRPRRR